MSWRSSLSMNPSRFWSIMLKASLNSWICDWSNMANTFEVALCGLFLVVFPFARLLDMMAVFEVWKEQMFINASAITGSTVDVFGQENGKIQD